jgi:hypothetical protein
VTTDADLLTESYLTWIRNDVSAARISDGITELATPFLDRHNDHLHIYAERRSPDSFLLTDDGYILSELRSSGVDTRGRRREELVRSLLAGHGVSLSNKELQVESSASDLGRRAHNLIQAMLGLDELFIMAQPTVSTVFVDQVGSFFDERDIRYTASAKFAGKSGLDHLVNFAIPKSRKAPERFVQVVSTPRRDRIANLLFAVSDTRSARPGDVQFYAVINDVRTQISQEIVHALHEYQVVAVPWSDRNEAVPALMA